jgi:NitT/TauT family transport system permease protein
MAHFLRRMWGGAQVAAERTVRDLWVDAAFLLALGGFTYVVYHWAAGARRSHQATVEIHLSLAHLPLYTIYSLCRGLIAYVVSLLFTLVYAYWAARDRHAERVLIPLLDILQSIPVLSFLPFVGLAMVQLFPDSNLGIELAAVILIFTGQVWNMTFSLYRSLRSMPPEMSEAATIFGFSRWQRVVHVELPFATQGLVWNSMMSMASGWFFLSVCEANTFGQFKYQLPGLGSFVQVANDRHDYLALTEGIVAMIIMIVALDQLLWRPLVVWAQRFRIEEGAASEQATSFVIDLLRRSRLACWCAQRLARAVQPRPRPLAAVPAAPAATARPAARLPSWTRTALGWLPAVALLGALAWGVVCLGALIADIHRQVWMRMLGSTGVTLARVVASIALGTLWTVPAGLAIGSSPRLARLLQPVIQVAASFPAPMFFPLIYLVLSACHIRLGFSSVLMMLLGTQWYILFNVIAGAAAIPADLRESAQSYGIRGWALFRQLHLPAIFPYLITGWVTASGAAWSTSIVAEWQGMGEGHVETIGLGAMMTAATSANDYSLLAATSLVMSLVVVCINRLLWHRLYRLAETTFSLSA